MTITVVDYSVEHYAAPEAMPRERGGKFIQLRRGAAHEYIVLAPREMCSYHANILERFLLSQGVSGRYNPKRDHYHFDHPEWEVLGGGIWSLDETRRELKLMGQSQAYGRFAPEGLKERLDTALGGCRIRISSL